MYFSLPSHALSFEVEGTREMYNVLDIAKPILESLLRFDFKWLFYRVLHLQYPPHPVCARNTAIYTRWGISSLTLLIKLKKLGQRWRDTPTY